jgi:hypothetical protein
MKPARGRANSDLPADFIEFVSCMNARAVEYLLVGGYALAFHGIVRATVDIDFLYRRTIRNVDALCYALADFGAPSEVLDRTSLMEPDTVVHFGKPPFRIDLLSDIEGVTFAEAWKTSAKVVLGDITLPVIGLEALKRNKGSTGREKDLADLRELAARAARRKKKR